ncbi:MAG: sigma-70 family RNA polymerase sigma factor [Bacteroidota bacterium]
MEYNNIHRDIVESCKLGNRQAQFELYRLYSKAMYDICLRMLKNELDAEDVLQNSFVMIFSKLNTFRYQSSVGAWIKRIVVNNCINYLKKKRLQLEELQERHSNAAYEATDDCGAEPSFSVEAINHALFQLPDGYRVVFTLYMLEGYDHKEIASILEVSEATSKSQYSRAKKKLKEILLARPMASRG